MPVMKSYQGRKGKCKGGLLQGIVDLQHAEENDCGMSGCLWRKRSEREGEEHDELQKPTFWISSISIVIVVIVAVCFATSPKEKEADNEKQHLPPTAKWKQTAPEQIRVKRKRTL